METVDPNDVDEQERRIREEQQQQQSGGDQPAREDTTPGDGSDGDDKGEADDHTTPDDTPDT